MTRTEVDVALIHLLLFLKNYINFYRFRKMKNFESMYILLYTTQELLFHFFLKLNFKIFFLNFKMMF